MSSTKHARMLQMLLITQRKMAEHHRLKRLAWVDRFESDCEEESWEKDYLEFQYCCRILGTHMNDTLVILESLNILPERSILSIKIKNTEVPSYKELHHNAWKKGPHPLNTAGQQELLLQHDCQPLLCLISCCLDATNAVCPSIFHPVLSLTQQQTKSNKIKAYKLCNAANA